MLGSDGKASTQSYQDLSLLTYHGDSRWQQLDVLDTLIDHKISHFAHCHTKRVCKPALFLLSRIEQVISRLREQDQYIARRCRINQDTFSESVTVLLACFEMSKDGLRCEPHLIVPCAQSHGSSNFVPRVAAPSKTLLSSFTPGPLYNSVWPKSTHTATSTSLINIK